MEPERGSLPPALEPAQLPPRPVSRPAEEPAPDDDAGRKRRESSIRPFQGPPPPRFGAWKVLLGMVAAGALGYFGVQWFVNLPPRVNPEVSPPREELLALDSGAPLEADAPVAEPTRTEALTPDAGSTPATPLDAGAPVDAAPPRVGPPVPEELDPALFLDGGSVPSGMGLLVVRAPRRGAATVEVQVDRLVLGHAPLTAPLAPGLHTLRFRAGVITSYQFVTLRAGRATQVEPPSDR